MTTNPKYFTLKKRQTMVSSAIQSQCVSKHIPKATLTSPKYRQSLTPIIHGYSVTISSCFTTFVVLTKGEAYIYLKLQPCFFYKVDKEIPILPVTASLLPTPCRIACRPPLWLLGEHFPWHLPCLVLWYSKHRSLQTLQNTKPVKLVCCYSYWHMV